MKYKERIQEEEYTCGISCILMILDYYHIYARVDSIKRASGLTLSGVTMYGLIKGLQSAGIEAKGYHCQLEDLKGPAILLVQNQQYTHYIVCYENKEGYLCNDPARGLVKYTLGELSHLYLGKAIMIEHVYPHANHQESLLQYILSQLKNYRLILLSIILLITNMIYQYLLRSYLNTQSHFILLFLFILYKTMIQLFTSSYLLKKQYHYLEEFFLKGMQLTINQDPTFYLYTRIEDLNNKMERIRELPDYIINILSDFYLQLFLFLLILSYLLYHDLQFAFIHLISYSILIISYLFFIKKAKGMERNRLEDYHHLIKKFTSILYRDPNNRIHTQLDIDQEYDQYVKSDRSFNVYILYFNTLLDGMMLLVLLFSFHFISHDLVFSILLVESMSEALITLLKHTLLYPEMNLRYLSFLDLQGKSKELVKEQVTSITLDHLSFSYGYHPYILDQITYCFKGHDLLKGSNGSGKSTLLKVIANQYDSYEGNLYYNKIRMKDKESNRVVYIDSELQLEKEYISDLIEIEWFQLYVPELISLYPLSISQLSKGNYQMIVFLYSLYLSFDVYLLDECFNHLDEKYMDIVERLLESDLLKEKIVICCEHHLKNIPKSFESVIMVDRKIKGE